MFAEQNNVSLNGIRYSGPPCTYYSVVHELKKSFYQSWAMVYMEFILDLIMPTKTCQCNIKRFFLVVKIEIFVRKILIFFLFLLKT